MSHPTKSLPFARRSGAVLVAATLALCGSARADDVSKMFSVSGFGTLGVVNSSNKLGDYVADQFQATGAGLTRAWAYNVDSKLALQVDGKLTDQLTAVVQVMARTRTNGTYSPGIEWANLRYAITPDLSVRVGRASLPVFLNSDTRLIGYASAPVRPPIETYSLRSISNADGVDGVYRRSMFGATNSVSAFYAKATYDTVAASGSITRGVDAKKMFGLVDNVEYGALTVRAAAAQFNLEVHVGPSVTIANAHVYNLGAVYDPGSWFVQSELTKSDFGVVQRGQLAMYVTGGYRWNKFTPYATYSKLRPHDDLVKLPLREQTSAAAGLRWDFMKNVDLKLQLEHVALAAGSTGFFTKAGPAMNGTSTKLISVALDFVY
jgi:hypothetical protein